MSLHNIFKSAILGFICMGQIFSLYLSNITNTRDSDRKISEIYWAGFFDPRSWFPDLSFTKNTSWKGEYGQYFNFNTEHKELLVEGHKIDLESDIEKLYTMLEDAKEDTAPAETIKPIIRNENNKTYIIYIERGLNKVWFVLGMSQNGDISDNSIKQGLGQITSESPALSKQGLIEKIKFQSPYDDHTSQAFEEQGKFKIKIRDTGEIFHRESRTNDFEREIELSPQDINGLFDLISKVATDKTKTYVYLKRDYQVDDEISTYYYTLIFHFDGSVFYVLPVFKRCPKKPRTSEDHHPDTHGDTTSGLQLAATTLRVGGSLVLEMAVTGS